MSVVRLVFLVPLIRISANGMMSITIFELAHGYLGFIICIVNLFCVVIMLSNVM
jgi:hypothetical protein